MICYDELNGPDIHRLENVMTLETGIHTLFDNLKLWLDADVSKIDYY
jgi:HNH endonuclease